MSLNYLLHRHQVSLMLTKAARTPEARRSHHGLVLGYAKQIDDLVGADRAATAPLVPLS